MLNTNDKKKKVELGGLKRLLTIDEAALYLGRRKWGVRELMYAGKLSFIKVGRRIHFDIRDLDKFIERHKTSYTF